MLFFNWVLLLILAALLQEVCYKSSMRTVCTPSSTVTSTIWGGFFDIKKLISPLRSKRAVRTLERSESCIWTRAAASIAFAEVTCAHLIFLQPTFTDKRLLTPLNERSKGV